MSLNNVTLTPALAAQLYPNTLVESIASPVPDEKPVGRLGKNAKGICIYTQDDNAPAIADADLQFLLSVLTACKLGLDDVVIINLAAAHGSASAEGQIIILFDVQPAQLGLPIHFPHYQVQAFNGKQYLSAPALTIISQNQTAKKELWTSLKKLFSL